MIHIWRGEDGHWTCAIDESDRECARLEALAERMEPNDVLGCYIDSAQIVARKAGLMQTPWDRLGGLGDDGLGTIFPHGPFTVPVPETAEDKIEVARMLAYWRETQRKPKRRRIARG